MATSKMTHMVSFFLLYLGMLVGVRGIRDFGENQNSRLDVQKQTSQRDIEASRRLFRRFDVKQQISELGIEASRRGHLVMQASGPPEYCVGVNADATWNVTELNDDNKCQSNSRFLAVPGPSKANQSFFLMNYDTGYVISCSKDGSECSLIDASQAADMTADGDAAAEFYFISVAAGKWFYIQNTSYGLTSRNQYGHLATYSDYLKGINPPVSLQISRDLRNRWQFRFENVISNDFCSVKMDCGEGGRKKDFDWTWCSEPCSKAHCCNDVPTTVPKAINELCSIEQDSGAVATPSPE